MQRSCRICQEWHDLDQPWPEACLGHFGVPASSSIQIIKDIEPYRAVAVDVATGKAPVIKSRADHKAFLKRNGYVEVGNERPRPRQHIEIDSPRPELTRAVREVLSRERHR